MGAVSAYDAGARPIDTNQSTLFTRPRRCSGTRVAMRVVHTIIPNAIAAPHPVAHAAMTQTELPSAKPRNGIPPAAHTSSIQLTWRRGRRRDPSHSDIAIAPAPSSARIVP